MKNFIQEGDVLDITLSADVASGGVVVAGDLVGVAVTDGKNGETIAVSFDGVYELPKATGAISVGAKLYWVVADGNISTTASGNKFLGYAAAAAVSGAATVRAKLSF